MPDNESTFDPGADLTPTFGANAALIEQAIELAIPNSYRGLIIYSETTPATTGEPTGYPTNWYEWHKRCIWFKPSTGEIFQFNGTTWALCIAKPGAGVITNAMIANGTIEFGKLAVTGGAALQILQINNLGTAWAFVDVASAIANNSIAVTKLIGGVTPGVEVLLSTAGSKAWTPFTSATIIDLFGANEFPVDSLARGSADQILTTNTAGTAISWRAISALIADYSIPIAKLTKVVGDAGKYLRRDVNGEIVSETLVIPSPVGTTFASASEVAAGTEAAKAIAPATVSSITGLVKASANVTITCSTVAVTAITLNYGSNIASAAISGSDGRLTFTSALASASYVAVVSSRNGNIPIGSGVVVVTRATTHIDIKALSGGGSVSGDVDLIII